MNSLNFSFDSRKGTKSKKPKNNKDFVAFVPLWKFLRRPNKKAAYIFTLINHLLDFQVYQKNKKRDVYQICPKAVIAYFYTF